MWNLAYKTQDTYIDALRQACEEKNVSAIDVMVGDFKKYFEKQNKESVGDMEVIKDLPTPEALAEQYENKSYTNKRALMKEGNASGGKRFGIGLLSFFVRIFALCGYLLLAALLVGGALCVAMAGIFQFELDTFLPKEISVFLTSHPYDFFANYLEGRVFAVALGVFFILMAGTLLKALRYSMKKYRAWVVRKISGCYRLPVSLYNIHSKLWHVLVYIFVPLSIIVMMGSGVLVFLRLK